MYEVERSSFFMGSVTPFFFCYLPQPLLQKKIFICISINSSTSKNESYLTYVTPNIYKQQWLWDATQKNMRIYFLCLLSRKINFCFFHSKSFYVLFVHLKVGLLACATKNKLEEGEHYIGWKVKSWGVENDDKFFRILLLKNLFLLLRYILVKTNSE